jgi:hypothetical protein
MFEISTRKWIPWNKSACYYASKNGHPECLKYLRAITDVLEVWLLLCVLY